MTAPPTPRRKGDDIAKRVIIIGAGIGGLAAALRLAASGVDVQLFERSAAPGGKMRALPSAAGPVAAGPTVLTLRDVFDDLFAAAGERIDQHVALHREEMLARHWWPDGATLDLFSDPSRNRAAVRAFAGEAEAARFERFCNRSRALYEAFDTTVMRAPRPTVLSCAQAALRGGPPLFPALAPWSTLSGLLTNDLKDPRLRQLFGRYATYVGGAPQRSPGVLALVWEAERRGVWRVEGGYTALATAIEQLARSLGATFHYNQDVSEIIVEGGRAAGVRLADADVIRADTVIFNGDPAALHAGLLGPAARRAVHRRAAEPRSLSAYVWSFAAAPDSTAAAAADLVYHNVFFGADPRQEFEPIARGAPPDDPTLYVCAQDRGEGLRTPSGPERFEIIMNAPPRPERSAGQTRQQIQEERERCRDLTFKSLERMGLRFTTPPEASAHTLTTPEEFSRMFPGSRGSLYGMSPHGMWASFLRPTARSSVRGLYLVGGGVHPGPGAPMAAMSGQHAAEAIASDQTSPSPRRRTAMPGGISTAYPRTAAERSR